MPLPPCPPSYDGSLGAFLDRYVAPALPPPGAAGSLLGWQEAVMTWARGSTGPLLIRKTGTFCLRGRVYEDCTLPFVVSDNEAALWLFMNVTDGTPPEPLDALVREERIPLAYALTAEEAAHRRWRTTGRAPRERAFAEAGWKHCHVLPGALRGVQPAGAEDVRRRAARLLSPMNHIPMPSPRRFAMPRDFGEAPDVLAFIVGWLRARYAPEPEAARAFEDFLAFAGAGAFPRGPSAEPQISFATKPRNEIAPLDDPERLVEPSVYVSSDDTLGSFSRRSDVGPFDALVARLRAWLATTDEAVLGNSPFGRAPWVRFSAGGVRCCLNADTTRAGVEELLRRSEARPFELGVAPNQKGGCNKIVVNGEPVSGLYGYTEDEQPAPAVLLALGAGAS